MIGDKSPCIALCYSFVQKFSKTINENLPVGIIQEYFQTFYSSGHDMLEDTR